MRTIALLLLVPFAFSFLGCKSAPARIDTPQPVAGNGNSGGPTKVQYGSSGNAPQAPQDGKSMANAAGNNGSNSPAGLGYRSTDTPSLPKLTLTSSQDRAIREQKSSVNLYDSYNKNLPWNSGSSPLGYHIPVSQNSSSRGRR